MRLVTSAKYLIGLAVFSAAVIVLAGSASAAADAASAVGSAHQVDDKAVLQTKILGPESTQPAADGSAAASASTSDGSVQSDSSGQPSIVNSANDSVSSNESATPVTKSEGLAAAVQLTAGSVTTSDSESSGHNTNVAAPTTASTDAHATVGSKVSTVGSTNKLASSAGVGSSGETTVNSAEASTPAAGNMPTRSDYAKKSVSEETSAGVGSAGVVLPVTVQPVAQSRSHQEITKPAVPESIVLGTQRVLIQPIITAHPLMVNDLAATVPSTSAASTGSMPEPTRSTGVLSSLTNGLANTVVPHTSALPELPVMMLFATTVYPIAMFAGLLTLVGLTFGASLRRAGYVTAARSDAVIGQTLFATPLNSGYVSALPNARHNPFLVVSEMKPVSVSLRNVMREEDKI